MAEEQEKNIIRLLAKGDEEAMGILFRSYHRLFWKPVFSDYSACRVGHYSCHLLQVICRSGTSQDRD
ncbi:hypothetical protein [Odoribacter sp. N15.MGS-14]|uniref:hypothetical protein n=1 Tax=Odoribacter sp. N15.MGS-14 TaxID=1637502 RepID=UPI0006237CC1|nr:hypothetical protein [Odoribacter sp. N15.MGS-14]